MKLDESRPLLFVVAGLPGVGKTTLARELSRRYGAYHLRVDAIENAMRAFELSGDQIAGSGYLAMANLAAENLALGFSSVVDCVNPLPLTRQLFLDVAAATPCVLITIEVSCCDVALHRTRLELRGPEPTWQEVLEREYHPWPEAMYSIDTAQESVEEWMNGLSKIVQASMTFK